MKQMNADYRDTYHFTGQMVGSKFFHKKTTDDMPSVDKEPEINTTIKPNPYRANVEIEKGEVVLQPDFTALHKALGAKHSRGGTPVTLPSDSFIFSDDKTLAFNRGDHDLMELKTGGNFRPKDNTPAKVVERNIPIKEYNRMTTAIDDPRKDDISKRSASLMVDKYLTTLGSIAYTQEQKKGFPQGLPQLAQGSAPVYDTQLKDELMQQKQYAKYGGSIENPYRMAGGGNYLPIDPYKKAHTRQGAVTPTGFSNSYNRGKDYLHNWESLIPGITQLNNDQAQGKIYDYLMQSPQGQHQISDMWHSYGLTNQGRKYPDLVNMTQDGQFRKVGDFDPQELSSLKKAYTDGLFGVRQMDYNAPASITPPMGSMTPRTSLNLPKVDAPAVNPLTPGEVTGPAQNGIPVNWEFTPFQKQSQLYNLSKWANVNRYMPYRSHFNATYAQPSLLNPEQAVADTKAAANQQVSALTSLSPILRNAQAAGAYGQYLNQAPGIRSQYDNQNAQIQNQFRQYNNQVKNNETLTNMQADQQYYQQTIQGQQNFDNMRGFLMDNFMNNRMQDVQTNQALAYNMLTLGPKPAYGYDFRSGNFYRNDKNILDVQSDSKSDFYTRMASTLMDKMNKGQELTKPEVDFFKALSIGKIPFTPSTQKKGGRVNPYK